MRSLLLVSDDEPLFIEVVRRFARADDIEVLPDRTSDVVDLARECKPCFIFLDLRQTVDGRDLLSALKQDAATRDIPVIVMSSAMDEYTHDLCVRLGAVDAIDKPLGHEIAILLDQVRAAQESRAA